MPSYTAARRNANLDALVTDIGASGLIELYDGSVPATVETALSGNTLLGTLTLSATAAPAASGGVLTFSAITDDSSADATGTPSFARITTSASSAVIQVTAGTSGTELILSAGTVTAGQTISASSLTITAGNA